MRVADYNSERASEEADHNSRIDVSIDRLMAKLDCLEVRISGEFRILKWMGAVIYVLQLFIILVLWELVVR